MTVRDDRYRAIRTCDTCGDTLHIFDRTFRPGTRPRDRHTGGWTWICLTCGAEGRSHNPRTTTEGGRP